MSDSDLNDRMLAKIRKAGFGVNAGETAEYVMSRVLDLAVPEAAGKVWFSRWQVERHANKALIKQLGVLLDVAAAGERFTPEQVAAGRAVIDDVRLLLPDVPMPATEAIVRSMAGADPVMEVEGQAICRFCLRPQWYPPEDPAHEPDCPWHLAREWVAEHPEDQR